MAIPLDIVERNRKCAYGGGRDDCPCGGKCQFLRDDDKPSLTRRLMDAEKSERSERGD